MRPVIIESPYRDEDPDRQRRNVSYLKACMHDSAMRGESPYSSVLQWAESGILDDTVARERNFGLELGWAWYRAVGLAGGLVALYIDRGISEGMQCGLRRLEGSDIEIEQRRLGEEWSR